MIKHEAKAGDSTSAGLEAGAAAEMQSGIKHRYHVECVRDGKVVWADEFYNLVTTAGKNKYLDATLKTGLTTPLWYVGLITGPGGGNTYAAADIASSHAGWTEGTGYSQVTRPAFTPGAISAGSVDNSAAKAVFSITGGNATIAGCFMSDLDTIGGTTGVLLGEGNFTGGDRAVQTGDTLNVTVTATQS